MIIAFSKPLAAQVDEIDNRTISSIIENAAEQSEEEDIDYTQLQELYSNLHEQPIDLNTAKAEELARLPILTDFQIYSLLQYIKEYGSLLSLQELTLVHGFTEETVNLIRPFVCIRPNESHDVNSQKIKTNELLSHSKNRVLLRVQQVLETRKGYSTPSNPDQQYYIGSPQAYYAQYRYQYKQILQLNITADKDAGEEFFKGSNREGFDFYSFHIQANNIGVLKKIVLGDFRASFGQGLCLWNGLSLGKGSDVLNIGRRATGLSAYGSANESQFMRGLAFSLGKQRWTFSPFASYKKIDASISSDTSSIGYSSLTSNGLHRTSNEITRKHVLSETIGGVNFTFRHTFWQLGTTAMWYQYGGNDLRTEKPYNLYDLHTSNNANASIDFKAVWKNVSFWGETGISRNGGKAIIFGSLLDMNRYVQLSFLYRNYQKNYQANYAGAFGTGSKTSNEEGFYWGINMEPFSNWRITAYFDSYSFPWLRYRVNAPSSGYDYFTQINFMPSSETNFHLRLQQLIKKQNITTGTEAITSVQELNYLRIRFQADYALTPELRMQSRVAYNKFSSEASDQQQGTLLYHDVGYKFREMPLTVTIRYSIFDTDSWETRFYAYEADVLHAFSVPAYYGQGMRYYFNMSYKVGKHMQIWFRLAQTHYFDQKEIGSGLSTIVGNKQTDAKMQLMIKW